MRAIWIATAALGLIALAGCAKQGKYEKSDGSFDRTAWRTENIRTCRLATADEGTIPLAERDSFCGCEMDRLLAGNSDDELRAFERDRGVRRTKRIAAMRECGGRWFDAEGNPIRAAGDGAAPGFAPRAPTPGTAPPPGVPQDGRTRPRANLASYVSADDYPASALRNNEQGRTAFVLTVGPDGRVTTCGITATSGSATLDMATCRIMRSRARFTPARDARGNPTADTYQSAVTWRLED